MRGRALLVTVAALVASVLVEVLLPTEGRDHLPWWHRTPGSFAAYGVLGGFVLAFVSKGLGALGISAPRRADDPGTGPLDPTEIDACATPATARTGADPATPPPADDS